MTISIQNMLNLDKQLNDRIVLIVVQQSCQQLKNANDIPRLYRRTNRELPKQASNYIRQAIECLCEFKADWTQFLADDDLNVNYMQKIIDQICQKFFLISNNLLVSVKKMEDSLKHLKRVRGDAKQAIVADTSSSSTSSLATAQQLQTQGSQTTQLSDDDKIRLQLYLDVCELGKCLIDKFAYDGGEHYSVLFKLVDDIKSQIEI
jgi:hypothetical protein